MDAPGEKGFRSCIALKTDLGNSAGRGCGVIAFGVAAAGAFFCAAEARVSVQQSATRISKPRLRREVVVDFIGVGFMKRWV